MLYGFDNLQSGSSRVLFWQSKPRAAVATCVNGIFWGTHPPPHPKNTMYWTAQGHSKSWLWQVLVENKDLLKNCTFRASSPLLASYHGAIIANPLFASLTTVRWMERTSFVLWLSFLLPPDWGNRALSSATLSWFQWMKHRFGLYSAFLLCWWQLFYTQWQLRDSSCFFVKFKNLLCTFTSTTDSNVRRIPYVYWFADMPLSLRETNNGRRSYQYYVLRGNWIVLRRRGRRRGYVLSYYGCSDQMNETEFCSRITEWAYIDVLR